MFGDWKRRVWDRGETRIRMPSSHGHIISRNYRTTRNMKFAQFVACDYPFIKPADGIRLPLLQAT